MGAESRSDETPIPTGPSRASVSPLVVPDAVRAPPARRAPRRPRPSLPLLSMSSTTCAGPRGPRLGRVAGTPGGEPPATWKRQPGEPRASCGLESVFLPPAPKCCVCVFSRLPHGRHPPFLAAGSQGRDPRPHPGVAAPARPLPAVTSSPACPLLHTGPAGDWTGLGARGTVGAHGGHFRLGQGLLRGPSRWPCLPLVPLSSPESQSRRQPPAYQGPLEALSPTHVGVCLHLPPVFCSFPPTSLSENVTDVLFSRWGN